MGAGFPTPACCGFKAGCEEAVKSQWVAGKITVVEITDFDCPHPHGPIGMATL
ncbi:MAG: hypothetical protein ABIK89_26430 [Planctomycetota bacterium]